jgi:uncharacterized membrane protein YtjA (UPF0391 family)
MRQKLAVAAGCLVCAVVCWKSFLEFEGSEFGSGELAGNQVIATLLFLLALIFVFKYPRAAPIIALVAAYFSLPLYLYLVFPRPFRRVFIGNWTNPELPRETFVWNGWWISGILFTSFVALICVSMLIQRLSERWSKETKL